MGRYGCLGFGHYLLSLVYRRLGLSICLVVVRACVGMLEAIVLQELLELRGHDFVRYYVSGDVGLKLPYHGFCSCRWEVIYG